MFFSLEIITSKKFYFFLFSFYYSHNISLTPFISQITENSTVYNIIINTNLWRNAVYRLSSNHIFHAYSSQLECGWWKQAWPMALCLQHSKRYREHSCVMPPYCLPEEKVGLTMSVTLLCGVHIHTYTFIACEPVRSYKNHNLIKSDIKKR